MSCATALAIACGDEESIPPPAAQPDSGSVVTNPNPNDSGSITEPPPDQTITDGGVNIDPDASDDDDDAGPDAAACNALLGDAAPRILSKCSSQIPGFTGGALVAGTYLLRQVEDLGPASFCNNQFTPVPISEEIVLTVDGTGVGTAQSVSVVANRRPKTSTFTLDPTDAGTSPLELTTTCPGHGSNRVAYSSAIRNNKQILILDLPYGQGGRALYHYEKQ